MKKPEHPINDLLAIATALGEIKATQTLMLDQLRSSATKDQLTNVKEDVDGLGKLIRENHSNLDGRVRVLESNHSATKVEVGNQGSLLSRILDIVFKIAFVAGLAVIGFKVA